MFVHELYIYKTKLSNSLKLSEFDRKRHLAVLERPFTRYLSKISVIFLFLYFRFRTGKIAILNMQTHSPLIYIYIRTYVNSPVKIGASIKFQQVPWTSPSYNTSVARCECHWNPRVMTSFIVRSTKWVCVTRLADLR